MQVAATIMLALHFKRAATTEKVLGFTTYLELAVHLADFGLAPDFKRVVTIELVPAFTMCSELAVWWADSLKLLLYSTQGNF